MVASEDPSLAEWLRPFQSPMRWVVLIHVAVLVTVIGLQSACPTSDVIQTLHGSVAVAQLTLIGAWTTLNRSESGSTFSPEVLVPLMMHMMLLLPLMAILMFYAILRGSPQWIMVAIFANSILSSFRLRGWQLKRFDCTAMPPSQPFQFSIRGTFLATGCVAVLFALRAVSTLLQDRPDEFTYLAILPELAITFVVLGCAPVVIIWATLTAGRILPRLAAAGFGLGLVSLLMFQDVPKWSTLNIVPTSVLATSLIIFLTTLLALRAIRYRVVWETPILKRIQTSPSDPSGTPNP